MRAGSRDGNEFKITTSDNSDDGKVLTVNSHSEGSRGIQDSTFVFNKQ